MFFGQVVSIDVVEATVALFAIAQYPMLSRFKAFELEVNISVLNAFGFIKDTGCDSGFPHFALIVGACKRHWGIALNVAIEDLALGFGCSNSKGTDCSHESEEHNQQDLDIRENKVREVFLFKNN